MKKVLIWGRGISGKACAELLKSKGIEFFIGDDNDSTDPRDYLDIVDTVVLSPGIPPRHPIWRLAQEKEIEVVGELELAWRFFEGKAIAITGTDGKSTTTHITYLILKRFFDNVEEGGNIGIPFSSVVLKNPKSLAVLEISSFQGKTLKTFKPFIGAFLNFSPDHLDWHINVDDYLHSKYNIFAKQDFQDTLILNANQEEVKNTPSEAKKVFFCESCQLRIYKGVGLYEDIELFDATKLKIQGRHNYYNALVASYIAYSLGVDVSTIQDVLYTFEGLPYRMEFLGEYDGVKVYNDSKSTTPNAMKAALESMPDGKVILIAGGKDKGLDFSFLRDLVKSKVKLAFLIGEARQKIREEWKNIVPIELKDTLEEAVKESFEKANYGDILLFSPGCASFDMFQDYKERGEAFKKLVQDMVKSI